MTACPIGIRLQSVRFGCPAGQKFSCPSAPLIFIKCGVNLWRERMCHGANYCDNSPFINFSSFLVVAFLSHLTYPLKIMTTDTHMIVNLIPLILINSFRIIKHRSNKIDFLGEKTKWREQQSLGCWGHSKSVYVASPVQNYFPSTFISPWFNPLQNHYHLYHFTNYRFLPSSFHSSFLVGAFPSNRNVRFYKLYKLSCLKKLVTTSWRPGFVLAYKEWFFKRIRLVVDKN